MKKILKLIGIVLIFLVVALAAIPFLFKGKIVNLIKTEANQKIYAHLHFKDDISISLLSSFPYLNIGIDDLMLSGKGAFEKDTLIAAKHIEVSIDLLSVISGQKTEIRKVSLESPRIYIRVLKDGRANYQITIPDSSVKTPEDTAASQFKLGLKLFEIVQGNVIYDDALYGVFTSFQDLDYALKGDFTQDDFILSNHLTADAFTLKYGGVPWIYKVKTSLDADLEAHMKDFSFKFINNSLALNELKLSLDGTFAMPGADMIMDLKFGTAQTDFKHILSLVPGAYSKDFASVKTSGKMGFNGFVKGTYNNTSTPSFGANLEVHHGGFSYPSMPVAAKNISLVLNIGNPDGLPDHTYIDIPECHAEAGNNPVDLKLHITHPVSDPVVDAALKGKVVLHEIKQMIPMEASKLEGIILADCRFGGKMSYINNGQYDQFKASGILGVQQFNYTSKALPNGVYIDEAQLTFSPQFAALNSFHLRTSGTDLNATGKLEHFIPYIFSNGILKGNLNLNAVVCNLNEFMSPDTALKKAPAPEDTLPLQAFALPLDIDFELKASAGTLYYDNLKLQEVSGLVSLKDGKANLTNILADIFGGQMQMSGLYDPSNIKKPLVDLGVQMKEVNIHEVGTYCCSISKLAGILNYMNGKMTMGFRVSGPLDEHLKPEFIMISADGNLDIPSFKISGYAPLDQVAATLQQPGYAQLNLQKVKAAFEVKAGKIKVKPFSIKLDQTDAIVSGYTALDRTIDYTLDLRVPRNQLGKLNQEIGNLLNQASSKGLALNLIEKLPVQLRMTGPATKPKIQADFSEAKKLLLASLKGQLKSALDEKKKELENQAKKEAEQLKKEAEQKAREEAERLKQKAQEETDRLKKQAEEKSKAEAEKLKQQGKEKLKGGLDQLLRKK